MVIARNERIPDVRQNGLPGGRWIVYTSEESHYSVRKNCGILGLGRNNLRKVPSDAVGRMIPAKLAEAIVEQVLKLSAPEM